MCEKSHWCALVTVSWFDSPGSWAILSHTVGKLRSGYADGNDGRPGEAWAAVRGQHDGERVMAGILLNSGSLQQYTAIGDEGQPVYSVAAQLREAVRLKVGAAAANCLAVPRVNESRSVIDWYSPVDGMVVPWSAATDEERTGALRDLDLFEQEMEQAIGKLGGVSDREKQTVQNLLGKVFHFPGRDCVFLVDGKPVLTFWGFQQGNVHPVSDPFHTLRPVTSAVPPPIPPQAPGPQEPARRRPWWLWLLLLLLLALLLFWLLRSCMQNEPVSGADPSVPVSQLEQTDPLKPPDPALEEPTGVVQQVQRWWQRAIGREPVTVDPAATGLTEAGVIDPATVDPSAVDPGGTDPDIVDPVTAASGSAQDETSGDGLGPELTEDPSPLAEAGTEDAAQENEFQELPGQEPAISADDQPVSRDAPSPSSQIDPGSGLGNPLAIPPDALKSGSVRFLNGNWRAAGGIQDSQTGKPVRLQYQFEDGRAKVTVDRGNGVQCEGFGESSIVDGRLQISEQGTVARCSDGSSFAIPAISCTPDQSGRSQCTGQTPDGRALPITIRQMP